MDAAEVKHVTDQFNAERKEAEQKLASALRLEKEVAKEDEKLSNAYWKLAKKNLDGEPTVKEQEAQRIADAAHKRLTGVWAAMAGLRRQLERFTDAELERRLTERAATVVRITGLKAKKGNTMATATKPKREKVEVPASVRKRIANDVKGGKGITTVMNELNAEKVKSASGGLWSAKGVWLIATKELGVTSLKGRKVKSKAVKDNPPRATRALPKKKVATARKRKASAATRKTAAARKRGGAKKRTTARKR